ncbi:hypothetical protein EV127DRAFT_443511 [Xylaria flabelliformis]|nr:hypothetical protein EV127DRAFT_443511 [Xylaria flabelliformis]
MSDFNSLPPAQQQAILNGPALMAPDGQMSQLENPPNDNVLGHAIIIIVVVLATIAFFCRIYARFVLFRQFKFVGDWLLILSYAFLVVDFVFSFFMLEVPGAFVHQWNVKLVDFINFLRNVFITSQLYIGVILPIKAAILFEWIRIFVAPGSRGFVFWASHGMIFAVCGFYIALLVAFNVACTPVEANWNVLIDGDCTRVNTKYTNLSVSVFNFISDVIILLIPQRVIWKLNMSTKKKIGISFIFAIGIFACAASLIRLVETIRHAESPDFTYTFSGIMLVSASEIALGYLVICVPYFPKAFSSVDLTALKSKLSFSSGSRLLSSQKRSHDASWPRSEYSKMEQKRIKDTEEDSLQLRILPPAYAQAHKAGVVSGNDSDDIGLAESGGIIRTTQFSVESDLAGNTLPRTEQSGLRPAGHIYTGSHV